MLNISKTDRAFLEKNIPAGKKVVAVADKKNDVNIILIKLYDIVDKKGFDPAKNSEWYNDFGKQAQAVYDRLYQLN